MRRLALLTACVPVLALAACNRGEVARVPTGEVALTQTDFRLSPQRVRVPPGRITFTVRNHARLPHNWQLRGRGGIRGRIKTLLPGETGTLTIKLKRGTYRMYCAIGHHEQLGEYGTVSVR